MHVLAYLGVSDLKSIGLLSFYVDPVKIKALTHVPFEERSTMTTLPEDLFTISQCMEPRQEQL